MEVDYIGGIAGKFSQPILHPKGETLEMNGILLFNDGPVDFTAGYGLTILVFSSAGVRIETFAVTNTTNLGACRWIWPTDKQDCVSAGKYRIKYRLTTPGNDVYILIDDYLTLV